MSDPRPERPWLRPLLILAVLWITWLVTAFLIGPSLLESAYAGTSFSFLNEMIRGRGIHSLDYYLAIGRSRVLLGSALLGLATAAILAGYRFRQRLVKTLAPVAGGIATPGPIRPLQIALIAGWIGMVLGLAEASRPAIQRLLSDWPTSEYYREGLWMVPLANSLTLTAIALLLVPIAIALWPRREGLRVIPATVGTIAVFTFIRYLGGVQPVSALVLAIGITVAGLRFGAAYPAHAVRLMRRSGAFLATALVLYASGVVAVNRIDEYRAARELTAAPAGAWNVVLLILDTVRAADVSFLDYERPTTPNLERLAREGIVFENAWSSAPWTLPAHASMFTGVNAAALSADYLTPLDDTYPTVAEALTGSGWNTAGFVSNYFYAGKSSGLARGFIHYEGHPKNAAFIAVSARLPLRIRRRWDGMRHDQGRLIYKTAEDVNRAFLDWLPATQERPFFAFLNYLDAHDPYTPPDPWKTRWAEPGARYAYGFNEKYSESDLQELRDRYDGAIAYIDDQIGRLVAELEARGRLDNTLIIVTSDHGEEFGEHDPSIVRHGWSLYSQALHVPLLMIMPGRIPAGTRIQEAVSTTSLAATILDVAVPGAERTVAGESLSRFWALVSGADENGEPVVASATRNPRESPPKAAPIQGGDLLSIVDDDLHYILRADGAEELYNTRSDPQETSDLSAQSGLERRIAQLRSLLLNTTGSGPR